MVPLIPTFANKAFICALFPDSAARMAQDILRSTMPNENEKSIKGPDTLESGQFEPTFPHQLGKD